MLPLICRGRNEYQSVKLALIYIRFLLPKSSKSDDLINLAKNITFDSERMCTGNFAYDTRLAQEAITAYLVQIMITQSQTLRIAVPRTQDGRGLRNQPESTEAGDDILPSLSARHHNPSITELQKEPAMHKENGCRFNST